MPSPKDPAKRNAQRKANYDQTRFPNEPRRYWSQQEDKAIMAEDRPTDRVLSQRLKRSVQAIQIRRSRLGGATERQVA